MLPRVLEAEVMDTAAEARDYDLMDFTEVNRGFVADFLAAWRITDLVLDVCTGPGRIPIELCRQIPTVEVVATDLSEHMLALAEHNVDEARLADRITVERADAKGLPFPAHHFGAVFCNGSVHHIPHPVVCFAEFHRVCAPGGTIFVRDLLRPDDEAALEHLVKTHAAGANDHQRQMFADSLRAALTVDEVRELVGRLNYPLGTVQQTSDRHWTWSATRS
jgi:ubiquinone/menaquinone biosynthesis C-methylase UbiE